MSCYEWSNGTIVLPSAEFARVKALLAETVTQQYQKEYDEAQRVWIEAPTRAKRDIDEYRNYLNQIADLNYKLAWKLIPYGEPKPRRLKKTDWDWPTNRTTQFHDEDLFISFNTKERTVTYSVADNNHAREHADATPLNQAFQKAMQSVRWSRSSGGVILGNDEYNRESGYDHEGGGGSYVVQAFGPVGAREAPEHVPWYLDSDGKKMMPEVTYTARGKKVKIMPYRAPMSTYSGRRW